MSSTRSRRAPARKPQPKKQPEKRGLPVPWIVGGVVAVALILAIVLSFGGGSSDPDVAQFGSPAVSGEALAEFQSPDPALGAPIPQATGADFDGTAVSISADGTPKAIVFLAHWCGHCQNEVPALQDWVDEGGLPDGVDLVAVATGTNETSPNYPPSEWLEREGFTPPVIVDDEAGSVANAFGLTGFPYWVFTDATGTVVLRLAGAQGVETIETVVTALTG
jgi:thiol-disulfide isomerase/thioredoxin